MSDLPTTAQTEARAGLEHLYVDVKSEALSVVTPEPHGKQDMARPALRSDIHHWITTGKMVYSTEYKAPVRSERLASEHRSTASSGTSNPISLNDDLVGTERDALLPTSELILSTLSDGYAAWHNIIQRAALLPRGNVPPYDLSQMLKDMPAFPDYIPAGSTLFGRPFWRLVEVQDVESPAQESHMRDEDDWDSSVLAGVQKDYTLTFDRPIQCRILRQSGRISHRLPSDRGLLILMLCWSYILSVRLYEIQRRVVRYSQHMLQPRTSLQTCPPGDAIVIQFPKCASQELVDWLCALLSPKSGWLASGRGFAPWAAYCPGDMSFIVVSDRQGTRTPEPPSSAHATELLMELCSIFGLEEFEADHPTSQVLQPYTAGFLAALSLPFSRYTRMQPCFSAPILEPSRMIPRPSTVRQHFEDLRYYMTLSIDPRALGSVIWSIFWEPKIECNVVSPWLASILRALEPVLEAKDLDLASKAFLIRKPRVGLWWAGIFLLGDTSILDSISLYLNTLEEQWGFASFAWPDSAAAVWTGSSQSFLDEPADDVYPERDSLVSIADVLRARHYSFLQETRSNLLSWRPFGSVEKQKIEPILWPWLSTEMRREYTHWEWWISRRGKPDIWEVQHGFRKDTLRFTPSTTQDSAPSTTQDSAPSTTHEPVVMESPLPLDFNVKIGPSLMATLRMVHFCVQEADGDQDNAISLIPDAKRHPWLMQA